MKNRPYIHIAIITLIGIFLWSCSSAPKQVRTDPYAPPASEKGGSDTAPAKAGNTDAGKAQPEKPPSDRKTELPVIGQEESNGDISSEKNGEEKEDAAALLEEAVTVSQEAQSALEKGEIDAALEKLDEAYSLILRAKTGQDAALCQEKSDLRLLVAQKIQQIYASHFKPAKNGNGTIPLVENKWVLDEIKSFQTRERNYFLNSYKRSGQYRPMIVEELKKAGLPEHISWLPFIESGYNVRAYSKARALGMWQFIRSTGYRYGLKQDKYIDERMDPYKATQAAIKFLTELHEFFGDWTTALASYNCGELRVQNVIRAQKIDYFDNFWDLFNNLPYETARFVPRIIAVMLIVENPDKYGFVLPEPDPPVTFETVTVNQPVKLSALASTLGIDSAVLTSLNSELRHDSTPNYEYSLKVPTGYGEKVLAALPGLPSYTPPEAVYGWHTVRSGETFGSIARRYRTSVSAIQRFNKGINPRSLRIGQRIKIPGKGGSPEEEEPVTTSRKSPSKSGNTAQDQISYTVKDGDTLFTLAKQFKTSIEKIKTDNDLDSDLLSIGQKLVINSGKS